MVKKSGFTLLEVLISTVILTVGVIAITWAFSTGMFASTDVENVDLALGIAQAKLEKDIYGTRGGVSPESRHDVSQDGFTGDIYKDQNFQLEVIVQTDAQTGSVIRERVDVNVYWDTKGGETSIALTTLVTN